MTNAEHGARVVPRSRPATRAHVAKHFVALSTNDEGGDEVRHRHRRTCSRSGTGSAGATRSGPRSGCRSRCAIGMDNFEELLAGAPRDGRALPHRRRSSRTCPVMLALLGVWYNNFFGRPDAGDPALRPVHAPLRRVLPAGRHGVATARASTATAQRDRRLHDRPGHLGRAGHQRAARVLPADPPGHEAHPVRLPRAGRDAQPARRAPRRSCSRNFFAQTEALMKGKTADEVRAELAGQKLSRRASSRRSCRTRSFPGNRPTNSIMFQKLTPRRSASLIALYEHKIFIAGHHLEHQQLRPVGRRARQAAREPRSCRS